MARLDAATRRPGDLEARHVADAGQGDVRLALREHVAEADDRVVQRQALALVDGQRPRQLQWHLHAEHAFEQGVQSHIRCRVGDPLHSDRLCDLRLRPSSCPAISATASSRWLPAPQLLRPQVTQLSRAATSWHRGQANRLKCAASDDCAIC